MKRIMWLICLALLVSGCAVYEAAQPLLPTSEPSLPRAVALVTLTPRAATPAPSVVPAEQVPDGSGLLWRECDPSVDLQQAEACLGRPLPALDDAEKIRSGVRTDRGLVLRDGKDAYEVRSGELGPLLWSTLYRNGRPLRTIWDGTPFHPSDISLQLIDGKVAWEFYGQRVQTVIYDGRDLRSQHDLDAAYRPYELDGKPIWIGKKEDAYIVMYDGEQVGPSFYKIIIAYCCETSLYAPRFGEGRYVFWGERGDGRHLVEITAAGQEEGAGTR
jgi:hypothetical protein